MLQLTALLALLATAPQSVDLVRDAAAQSHLLGDRPVSIGATYKATYDESGASFHPLLGRNAPMSRRVSYRFESASLGGEALGELDLSAAPILEDGRVVYHRGAGLTETYFARDDGLEQLFRLDELPGHAGELVVRGSLATDLEPRSTTPSEIRFSEPALAEIVVSHAVAFDGEGRHCAVEMRRVGAGFDLVVPAPFIAEACLPLVIDPLFSVEFQGSAPGVDARQPDIARGTDESGDDLDALVYRRFYSATDSDITAVTFTSDGTLNSTYVAIETVSGMSDESPVVGFNPNTGLFGVAWDRYTPPVQFPSLLFTSFDPALSSVQSEFDGFPAFAFDGGPDIVGDATAGSNLFILVDRAPVWIGTGAKLVMLQVDGVAPPIHVDSVNVPEQFSETTLYDRLRLFQSPRAENILVLVHQDSGSFTSGLWITTVDKEAGQVLNTKYFGSGNNSDYPAVASDKLDFVVVYQSRDSSDRNSDLFAKTYKIDGVTGNISGPSDFLRITATPGVEEIQPVIARVGEEYLITYARGVPGSPDSYEVVALTLDPDTLQICEPPAVVGPAGSASPEPEIASSRFVSDVPNPRAAIAYQRLEPDSTSTVQMHLWQADGGGSTVATVGSACGSGGAIGSLGSASIGSSDFAVTLTGAAAAATSAVLNVTLRETQTACGDCIALPLDLVFSAPFVPTTGGPDATFPIPLRCVPSLAGQSAAFQWITWPTGPSPCPLAPGVSFSDRLEVTLGF